VAATIREPAGFLERSTTRAGLVARRDLLDRPRKGDVVLARRIAHQIRARQRADGSWDGTVYDTAWALWELEDLGAPRDGAVERSVAWLLQRQGAEGAYRPEFFGSGPRRARDQVTIFSGDRLSSSNLLVGESCLAARSLLRLRRGRREAGRMLRALADLMRQEQHVRTMYPGRRVHGYCCGRCTLGALEAFSQSSLHRDRLAVGSLRWMETMQRGDGTWQRFPFYFALDVLSRYDHGIAARQVEAALPAIRRRRNEDGSWGAARGPEQTLIVSRALFAHGLEDD